MNPARKMRNAPLRLECKLSLSGRCAELRILGDTSPKGDRGQTVGKRIVGGNLQALKAPENVTLSGEACDRKSHTGIFESIHEKVLKVTGFDR